MTSAHTVKREAGRPKEKVGRKKSGHRELGHSILDLSDEAKWERANARVLGQDVGVDIVPDPSEIAAGETELKYPLFVKYTDMTGKEHFGSGKEIHKEAVQRHNTLVRTVRKNKKAFKEWLETYKEIAERRQK